MNPAPPPGHQQAPARPPARVGKTWMVVAAATAAVSAAAAGIIALRSSSAPDKTIAGDGTRGGGELPEPVKSTAADHAPTGCDVLVRIDLARLLAARVAITHLVPVLDEIATGGGTDSEHTRRTGEFLRAAAIDPRRDVADVLVCAASLEGPTDQQRLALVFGGSLRPETLVAAINAQQTGDAGRGAFDGRKVARTKSRRGDVLILGQAADGAIVISNDSDFFESAVKSNKSAEEVYRLPTKPEVATVVVPEFFQRPAPGPEGPLTRHRADVRRLHITASLLPTGGAQGELRAFTRDARAAEALRADGDGLLDGARNQAAGLEGALLSNAKLRLEGAELVMEAVWTEANVEEVVKSVAKDLRAAFRNGALAL